MFNDIMFFIKGLTFIDYVFFFTVIFLLILIVSLIYFIRINEDMIQEEEKINDPDNLRAIASSIKTEAKPITFTSYEKEQEEKAIISYEELLSNTGEFKLNYIDEEPKSDLSVKKVDLSNLITPAEETPAMPKMEVHLFSLKREEEFLTALKELQSQLN